MGNVVVRYLATEVAFPPLSQGALYAKISKKAFL